MVPGEQQAEGSKKTTGRLPEVAEGLGFADERLCLGGTVEELGWAEGWMRRWFRAYGDEVQRMTALRGLRQEGLVPREDSPLKLRAVN